MKYQCFERTNGGIRQKTFLGRGANQYLDTCEAEIYKTWKERNTPQIHDVSLAYTLTASLLKRFKKREIGVDSNISDDYSVYTLFQHTNDTAGKFVDMFYDAKKQGTADALIITQSENFKSKFNYDTSTMTIDSIREDFDVFVDIFRPSLDLRLLFLVLDDLDIYSSIYRKGDKEYLKLSI